MQAAALETVSVSNTQFQFFMTKLSMERLKLLALRARQPMCCIFDPHGHANRKKKGGFKTLEVKCPQKWKSPKVTLWLHSSGFVKVVAVKSKEEAVRVARSFERMVQSVRGFRDVRFLQESGVELSMLKADMDLKLPGKINLRNMVTLLPDRTDFEPELYMGLKVQWSHVLKLILFSTGKVMICPMVVADNRAALEADALAYLRQQVSAFVHVCLESYDHQ